MQRKLKHILWGALTVGFLYAGVAYAATLQPFQGGTGFSTSSAGTVGQFLQVASTSPFLTYQFAAPSSASTTVINGVTGPTFTISFVTTSSDYSITTSSAQLFLNILASSTWLKTANNLSDLNSTSSARTNIGYTGIAPISISATGTIIFTNPSYVTSTGANPTATISTSTQNGTANTFMRSDGAPAFSQSLGYAFSALGNTTSTANVGASTFNASTSITNQGVKNALVLNNGSGLEGAYGATSCAAGTAFTGLSASGTPTCSSFATSTGGTPAGASNDVQFNNNGSFSADSGNFVYGSTTKQLGLTLATSSLLIGKNFSDITTASSVSFAFTGAIASWTAPANIIQNNSSSFNLTGASGGFPSVNSGTLATGGNIIANLQIAPGTTYWFCVGQAGANGLANGTGEAPALCGGGISPSSTVSQGGGGGGSTWVSTTSTFTTSTTAYIIAGGGGGGSNNVAGGNGGGTTGQAGANAGVSSTGGGGGTPTAGGAAGSSANAASAPSAGSSAQGGNGGGVGNNGNGGGGGGGGLFGGGGGGGNNAANNSSGGGGGSSGQSSNFTNVTSTQGGTTGNGSISISYLLTSSDQPSSTYALAVGGHVITGGNEPAISSCGISPQVNGNDTAGIASVGAGVVTACTITFLQTWQNPPVCTMSTNSTAVTGDISSISTSSVIFGLSATLGGGKIYYICLGY